jgi:hypothetical protein
VGGIIPLRRATSSRYDGRLGQESAVQASHAGVGLGPDAKIFEFGKDILAGIKHFAHMAPIHADKMDEPSNDVLIARKRWRAI